VVPQHRRPSRPGPDRGRGPDGGGGRRAAARAGARAGRAADHHCRAPLRSVPGQDRPGAADHPPDAAIRQADTARMKPVRPRPGPQPSGAMPGGAFKGMSLRVAMGAGGWRLRRSRHRRGSRAPIARTCRVQKLQFYDGTYRYHTGGELVSPRLPEPNRMTIPACLPPCGRIGGI
jgi:hypothetical protein